MLTVGSLSTVLLAPPRAGNIGVLAAALTIVLPDVANQEKSTWAAEVAAEDMDAAHGDEGTVSHPREILAPWGLTARAAIQIHLLHEQDKEGVNEPIWHAINFQYQMALPY